MSESSDSDAPFGPRIVADLSDHPGIIDKAEARNILKQMVKGDFYEEGIPIETVHFDESEVEHLGDGEWAMDVVVGEPRTPDRQFKVDGDLNGLVANGPDRDEVDATVTYFDPDRNEQEFVGEVHVAGSASADFKILLGRDDFSASIHPDGRIAMAREENDWEHEVIGRAKKIEIHNDD